jgi:MFS family permease
MSLPAAAPGGAAPETVPALPPAAATAPSLRRIDRRLWILFLGRLVTSTGYSISFPFFGIYFHTGLDVPMTTIGFVIFLSGLTGAAAKFFGGELADRLGRKTVMIAALVGRAAATAGIAWLAAQAEPAWLPMATLFVVGTWFGFFFDPAAEAMVADVADPARRVEGYSLLRVGGNLGWALGGGLGGLIGSCSYPGLFLSTSLVSVVALALLAILVTETRSSAAGRASPGMPRLVGPDSPLSHPGFLHFGIACMVIHMVMSQLAMPLSVYAKTAVGLPENLVGLFFTINGLIIVSLQMPTSKWIHGKRLTTALVAGCLLYAAGYGSAAMAVDFWTLAGSVAVFTVGELLVAPSVVSMAANFAPPELRGRFLGAFGLFSMLGRCLGPLLGGLNLDLFGRAPWAHWLVISGLAGAAAAAFFTLRGRVAPSLDRA